MGLFFGQFLISLSHVVKCYFVTSHTHILNTTVIGVSSVTNYMEIFGIDTAAVNKVDFRLIFAGFLCEECVYMLLGDL